MLPYSYGVSAGEECTVVKVRHWQSGLDGSLTENHCWKAPPDDADDKKASGRAPLSIVELS
jgi:hypothetical protein